LEVTVDIHIHAQDLAEFIRQLVSAINRGTSAITRMEAKLAEIDDKLAAMTAAVTDLSTAVDSIVSDLTAEHQQLVDALAALAAGSAVTPEQLAAMQASTDAIGAMAGRLRQAVIDTPDPTVPPPAA